jgi:gas vesicle protein
MGKAQQYTSLVELIFDFQTKILYYTKHMTTNSKEAKVYQLVQELEQAIKEKKAVVKGHNNNIKRIKDEIKDILESEDEEANDQP